MTTPRRKTEARKRMPSTRGPRSQGRLQRAIDEVVRREIGAALKETGGNVTRAAKALGIGRVSLWKRMRALGIDADS